MDSGKTQKKLIEQQINLGLIHGSGERNINCITIQVKKEIDSVARNFSSFLSIPRRERVKNGFIGLAIIVNCCSFLCFSFHNRRPKRTAIPFGPIG